MFSNFFKFPIGHLTHPPSSKVFWDFYFYLHGPLDAACCVDDGDGGGGGDGGDGGDGDDGDDDGDDGNDDGDADDEDYDADADADDDDEPSRTMYGVLT